MADDLAFLFDDPGRRRVVKPTAEAPIVRGVPRTVAGASDRIEWRTLRQAHDETSIPVSTLRKWAKKGKVRARLVRTEGRELRLVAFGDILDRARSLEREVAPIVAATPAVSVPAQFRSGPDAIHPVATVPSASTAHPPPVASREPEPVADPEPGSEPVAGSEAVAGPPEGSILVPLDAWDRLLGQLGNLHEAGQQLAAARERAAKAETEAEFLRERLREMRKRVEDAELALDLQAHRPPEVPGPAAAAGWKRWRSRWLGY